VKKLLSLIRKPCRFKALGGKMMISELDQHEITCSDRVVLCIYEKCCRQLLMPKLFAHLQTFHPTHLNFTIPIEPRLGEVSKATMEEDISLIKTTHLKRLLKTRFPLVPPFLSLD
jgi:hypothetical protein